MICCRVSEDIHQRGLIHAELMCTTGLYYLTRLFHLQPSQWMFVTAPPVWPRPAASVLLSNTCSSSLLASTQQRLPFVSDLSVCPVCLFSPQISSLPVPFMHVPLPQPLSLSRSRSLCLVFFSYLYLIVPIRL